MALQKTLILRKKWHARTNLQVRLKNLKIHKNPLTLSTFNVALKVHTLKLICIKSMKFTQLNLTPLLFAPFNYYYCLTSLLFYFNLLQSSHNLIYKKKIPKATQPLLSVTQLL